MATPSRRRTRAVFRQSDDDRVGKHAGDLRLFASTSVIVGVLWDISWHAQSGRDTFWTPAHLAIYLGTRRRPGIVASSRKTLAGAGANATRQFGLGFAPFVCVVSIWGAFAMVTLSFDDCGTTPTV
jgi:hypothetical protein